MGFLFHATNVPINNMLCLGIILTMSPPKRAHDREKFSSQLATVMLSLRESKTLSKNKLSQQSGVSRQAIRMIESGEREPAAATLYDLAKGMGIPLWKIIKQAEEAANK